jgi:hypothetical protein
MPSLFVSVCLATPVSILRRVTLTSGTIPPDASRTDPPTVPTGWTWAFTTAPASNTNKHAARLDMVGQLSIERFARIYRRAQYIK